VITSTTALKETPSWNAREMQRHSNGPSERFRKRKRVGVGHGNSRINSITEQKKRAEALEIEKRAEGRNLRT